MLAATRRSGTRTPRATTSSPTAPGRRRRSRGASGTSRSPRSARCRRSTGSTWSSSAAARPTSRPGSRAGARGRSASTCRRTSWPPPSASRRSTRSSSRSSTPAPRTCRCPTSARTSWSASTARACGAIRTCGWRRPRACCARAAGSCFLTNSLLIALTAPDEGPATDRLLRDQRGLREVTYAGEDGVEFHLAHGDWIATLARHGFTVDALHELYAPDGAQQTKYEWATPEWAHRWPVEEIWTATWRS